MSAPTCSACSSGAAPVSPPIHQDCIAAIYPPICQCSMRVTSKPAAEQPSCPILFTRSYFLVAWSIPRAFQFGIWHGVWNVLFGVLLIGTGFTRFEVFISVSAGVSALDWLSMYGVRAILGAQAVIPVHVRPAHYCRHAAPPSPSPPSLRSIPVRLSHAPRHRQHGLRCLL